MLPVTVEGELLELQSYLHARVIGPRAESDKGFRQKCPRDWAAGRIRRGEWLSSTAAEIDFGRYGKIEAAGYGQEPAASIAVAE